MQIDVQRQRADAFRALHSPGDPVVLVNVWDAVSARIVEQAGFPAIATTSAGVAWSLGYPDGEFVSRDEMLSVVERVARSVSLPVTADLESAYAANAQQVGDTVRAAIDAGAVGMNLEDARSHASPSDPLFSIDDAVSRVAAARAAADAAGIAFTINARTDVYLGQVGPEETRFERAVERVNAYRAAGADCLFVPGVRDASVIGALVKAVNGPLNALAGVGSPSIAELGRLGVARLSFGSSSMRVALSAFADAVAFVRDSGAVEPIVGASLSFAQIEALLR